MLTVLIVMIAAMGAAPAEEGPTLTAINCPEPGLSEVGAECWTVQVPENWDSPEGRTISFDAARIKGPKDAPPYFFLQGGPVTSVFDSIANHPDQFEGILGTTDFVAFNPRGSLYASPSLHCPGFHRVNAQNGPLAGLARRSEDWRESLSAEASWMQACAAKLEAEGIDTRFYNHYQVAHDLEFLRKQLGYDAIFVEGFSNGGDLALRFAGMFPDSVAGVILNGPWYKALSERSQPDVWALWKHFLTDKLATCVAQAPGCAELIPDWPLLADKARLTLDAAPASIRTPDSSGLGRIEMDGTELMWFAYNYFPQPDIPRLLRAAADGDVATVASIVEPLLWVDADNEDYGQPMGNNRAYSCLDDSLTPEIAKDWIEREPALLGFEGTHGCAWWPRRPNLPATFLLPPAVDAPVLAMTGQFDPAVGPFWIQTLARWSPKATAVVFSNEGHGIWNECRSKLVLAFMEDTKDALDTTCAQASQPRWNVPEGR